MAMECFKMSESEIGVRIALVISYIATASRRFLTQQKLLYYLTTFHFYTFAITVIFTQPQTFIYRNTHIILSFLK
jgi:hypothetical protein